MSIKENIKEKFGVIELSSKLVKGIYSYFKSNEGIEIINKKDDIIALGAGYILQAIGVMDKDKFLNRFTTTIGRRVYIPFEVGGDDIGLGKQIGILLHELEHVKQYREEGEIFFIKYALDTVSRSLYEASAYCVNLEFYYRVGALGNDEKKQEEYFIDYKNKTKERLNRWYKIKDSDLKLVDSIMESYWVLIKQLSLTEKTAFRQVRVALDLLGVK